jgi:hypothetical protein
VDVREGERGVGVVFIVPARRCAGVVVGRGRWEGGGRGGEDDAVFAEVGQKGGGEGDYAGFEGGGFVSFVLLAVIRRQDSGSLLLVPIIIGTV